MKVGIITRHAYPNYGSLLQAYALQEALTLLGVDAVCIDYINKSEESWHLCFSQLKESRMNTNLFKRIAYCAIQLPNYMLNTHAFRKMQLKHLNLTNKFSSSDDIIFGGIDILCTGSDQVWNRIHNKLDCTYFLDFADDKTKKISYAASFGTDTIAEPDRDTVARLVSRYEKVSVREESGVRILEGLSIHSVRVVDPVLLFDGDYWSGKTLQPRYSEQYIVIYQLHYNKKLTEIAHKLAKAKGQKIIRLTCELKQRFIKDEKVVYLPDAETFLGYLKYASYVVTDSFHGTVFSLQFHKQFVEVSPGVNKTRNENLLKMTGLTDRFVDEDNVLDVADRIIDYESVDKILACEREMSWGYLEDAIKL